MGSIDDIMQLCRLCLVKDQVNIPIFDETSDIRQTFVKINQCLPVKVSRDDNLPKKICDGCSYKLDMLYVFRNTSVESEKQLVSWLSQTIVKDGVTKPEIMVKQETFETTDARLEGDNPEMSVEEELGVDAHTYIMQQQKLPYQQDFATFGEPSGSSEEPPPKKAKRVVAVKKQHVPVETEEDALETAMQITKAEEEDSDDVDQPDYAEAPSTSADDQPGPSGVGKGTIEAPVFVEFELIQYADKEMYKCKVCNEKYETQRACAEHKRAYHSLGQFYCKECGKLLETRWDLYIHFASHQENDKYKPCKTCGKLFKCMKTHEKVHLPKAQRLVCHVCGKSYHIKWKAAFDIHVKSHSNGDPVCQICNKTFTKFIYLRKHVKRHEQKFEDCHLVVSEDVPSKRIYKNPKYLCETCGRVFGQTGDFIAHKRLHTGEKPFSCVLCGMKFRRQLHLRSHILTHTKEKRHLCKYCGKLYTRAQSLRQHIKVIHTQDKPHSCNICQKRFVNRHYLKKHLDTHSRNINWQTKQFNGELVCEICNKNFTKDTYLKKHLKRHG